MKKAAETVAAKIRAGEITSGEDAGKAFQAEIGKAMGGGIGGRRGGNAPAEGDN